MRQGKSLVGSKRLIESARRVRVQVILHQAYLLGIRERFGDLAQKQGVLTLASLVEDTCQASAGLRLNGRQQRTTAEFLEGIMFAPHFAALHRLSRDRLTDQKTG